MLISKVFLLIFEKFSINSQSKSYELSPLQV